MVVQHKAALAQLQDMTAKHEAQTRELQRVLAERDAMRLELQARPSLATWRHVQSKLQRLETELTSFTKPTVTKGMEMIGLYVFTIIYCDIEHSQWRGPQCA